MKKLKPVSVIVNVYNEAETIEAEIRKLHEVIVERIPNSEFIVAEDGSTDGTKEIIYRLIDELGIIHSTGKERKGYAKALRDAFLLAKCPNVFFSDTGNKHNPEDFWKLYSFCNDYDLIIGIKSNRTDQLYRKFLTWGYNKLISYYFGINVNDADSGFRIYKREVVQKIFKEDWVFKELIASELTLRSIYSGFKIKEVPVSYTQRKGQSRGLPFKKIPKVIFRILCNLPKLKKVLQHHNYKNI